MNPRRGGVEISLFMDPRLMNCYVATSQGAFALLAGRENQVEARSETYVPIHHCDFA
jgi:hypothetical protein